MIPAAVAILLAWQGGEEAPAPPAASVPAPLLEQLDREREVAARKLRTAFVSVRVQRGFPIPDLILSGTLLDGEGRFAVPAQGLADHQTVYATVGSRAFKARALSTPEDAPVAILQLLADAYPPAPHLAPAERPRVGDTAVLVANALSFEGTASFGVVSATDRAIRTHPGTLLVQTTLHCVRGAAGGPVGNRRGEVVGMLLGGPELTLPAEAPAPEGIRLRAERSARAPVAPQVEAEAEASQASADLALSLMVPVERILALASTARPADAPRNGEALPFVGVFLNDEIDELVRVQLRLPTGVGLAVDHVIEQSPAMRAGVAQHDIVIAADDVPVGRNDQFRQVLREAAARGKIRMEVLRNGARVKVEVRFERGPAPREEPRASSKGKSN